ncbi:MFS transporter [Penicillium maclennaniae]|uniref:MFS transporter n=1 Tax=Penicillium maclennaniae TaxID=1343394 RepID=UPI00254017A5|nr:MFS transporter [Penicillium maclennaniae]KAJ5668643.1 MFS transporter [Penicillium maclennaniae]
MALIYLTCFLDRSNIANAKVLNKDTSDNIMYSVNISEHQYRVALMLFLVAYYVFKAPSNLALKVFSPLV